MPEQERRIDVFTTDGLGAASAWTYETSTSKPPPWRYSHDERGFEAALAEAHCDAGEQTARRVRGTAQQAGATEAHQLVGALLLTQLDHRCIDVQLAWLGNHSGLIGSWGDARTRITAALKDAGWTREDDPTEGFCPRYCRDDTDITGTMLAAAQRIIGKELARGPRRTPAEASAAAQQQAHRIVGQWLVKLVEHADA